MKKTILIFVFFISLLITLVLSLNNSNKKIDSFFFVYKNTSELISLNKNLELFMSTSLHYNNFDYIQKDITRLNAATFSILSNSFFIQINNKKIKDDFFILKKSLNQKILYVERLITKSAALNNSYRYLQRIFQKIDNKELTNIYTYLITLEHNPSLLDTNMTYLINTLKTKNENEVLFISHSKLILKYLKEFEILKAKSKNLDLENKILSFKKVFIEHSSSMISSIKVLIWVLMFFLFIALIFLIFYIYQTTKRSSELSAFKNAVQNSDNIVVITNKNHEIKFVNETFEKATGYSSKEALGQKPSILKSGVHDEIFYNDLKSTIEAGKKWRGEFVNKNKFNEVTYEKASITPIFNEKGEIYEYIAIKLDITKEKQASKVLKEKEDLLAKQSKMVSMRDMLESIAHQWRQPLSSISTAASGLKLNKEFKTLDDKNFDELTDAILKNSSYLSTILDNFKSFYNAKNEKTVFLLSHCLGRMKDLISYKLNEEKIELFITNKTDIQLEGLENELMQVLLSIIVNSQEAFIRKKIENKKIFISIFKDDSNVLIEIKDNAQGIDDDIIPHIFEPYFTTKHKSQGTGLGLYMTYETIKNHFLGVIYIDNTQYEYEDIVLKGVKVTIKIPL